MQPFDFVNDITVGKKDIMRGTLNDELAEEDYDPFLTNRALSFYHDLIYDANQMNLASGLDKRLQFSYYFHNVRKMDRKPKKWPKKDKDEELILISEHYNISKSKAREARKLLTKKQIEIIRQSYYKGGRDVQ